MYVSNFFYISYAKTSEDCQDKTNSDLTKNK